MADQARVTGSVVDRITQGCGLSRWQGHDRRCRWCDGLLRGRQRRWCSRGCEWEWQRQHVWTVARACRLERDGCCVRCGSRSALEVNHRVPLVGRGYAASCLHHQDRLETLCHVHHVEVTNQQRLDRETPARAYARGLADGRRDVRPDECPYTVDVLRAAWVDGWKAAPRQVALRLDLEDVES